MNKLTFILTKWQIKLIGGTFVRTQVVTRPNAQAQEITIFSGDSPYLGQCTWWRTILINESVIANPRCFNYVFLHEMGHKNQWWSFFAIPLVALFGIGFVLASASLGGLLYELARFSFQGIVGSLIGILLGLLMVAVFSIFIRLVELNADCKAIEQIGVNEYKEIKTLLPKAKKRPLSARLLKWLFYFSSETTVLFYEKTHSKPLTKQQARI